MHGQQKLLQLLDENHIDCVILKGSAAALSYPQPILRVMGDVDFLVRKVDYEKTADLLEKTAINLLTRKMQKTIIMNILKMAYLMNYINA